MFCGASVSLPLMHRNQQKKSQKIIKNYEIWHKSERNTHRTDENSSKLEQMALPSSTVVPKQPHPFSHWSTPLLISISGAALTGLSFLVLQQSVTEVDQMAVRDNGALWMVSIGKLRFNCIPSVFI